MRKLYLIRHGQTIFNEKNLLQGCCDSPLTDLGHRQTLAAKDYINSKNLEFDKIYTSPLRRCIETTHILTKHPYTTHRGLMEWNFGTLEGDHSSDVFTEIRWSQLINGEQEDFFENHGGESHTEFTKRFSKAIDEIIEEGHQSTLLVTHGAVMRIFFNLRNNEKELNGEYFMNSCILEYNITENNELEFVRLINPAKKVK